MATKKAHSATAAAILHHVVRQSTYWLLIFPEKCILDNVIFSGNPINIESSLVGMEVVNDDGLPLRND
jgi:hypothetical protein